MSEGMGVLKTVHAIFASLASHVISQGRSHLTAISSLGSSGL